MLPVRASDFHSFLLRVCRRDYYGKVLLENGIILTNLNLHAEAAKCFLHADSLGVGRDDYYGNGD